ncbi:MAG: hypothetical protein ACRCUS_05195, partial [Anaerovoracaceae bacterium]
MKFKFKDVLILILAFTIIIGSLLIVNKITDYKEGLNGGNISHGTYVFKDKISDEHIYLAIEKEKGKYTISDSVGKLISRGTIQIEDDKKNYIL